MASFQPWGSLFALKEQEKKACAKQRQMVLRNTTWYKSGRAERGSGRRAEDKLQLGARPSQDLCAHWSHMYKHLSFGPSSQLPVKSQLPS